MYIILWWWFVWKFCMVFFHRLSGGASSGHLTTSSTQLILITRTSTNTMGTSDKVDGPQRGKRHFWSLGIKCGKCKETSDSRNLVQGSPEKRPAETATIGTQTDSDLRPISEETSVEARTRSVDKDKKSVPKARPGSFTNMKNAENALKEAYAKFKSSTSTLKDDYSDLVAEVNNQIPSDVRELNKRSKEIAESITAVMDLRDSLKASKGQIRKFAETWFSKAYPFLEKGLEKAKVCPSSWLEFNLQEVVPGPYAFIVSGILLVLKVFWYLFYSIDHDFSLHMIRPFLSRKLPRLLSFSAKLLSVSKSPRLPSRYSMTINGIISSTQFYISWQPSSGAWQHA